MKKIIIIRGNSGSGKTTVSKILQEKLGENTLLISQDYVRRELLNFKRGVDTTTQKLCMHLVEYGHNNNDYVVMEGIFNSNKYKKLFQFVNKLYNENIFAYYYDIPFEETLKRHANRKERDEFGEDKMRSWWVAKDYLENINETKIDENVSIAEAVDMILRDIGLH